ncbi:MAG: glycosyltransferase family 4 protein [Candidatus Moranbacteria bacterium]|nr:glycosyltransferase family 4 protein [Candidatus Moranbacteria bacterium]
MMKILFISRAYPPIVGGIENQNYELSVWLGKDHELVLIKNPYGKVFLPFFFPWAVLRSVFLARSVDCVLLGDGVLSFVGWFVKVFSHTPVACIVHGLDITYPSRLYQNLWVKYFLKKMDLLIAVGTHTITEAVSRGIPKDLCVFVPNGIDPEKYQHTQSDRQKIEELLCTDIEGKKILLTTGRLARRKGVAWFIRNVLSELEDDVLYVVAGTGPDEKYIRRAISATGLSGRVFLLGFVSDQVRNDLMASCDLFIQPNVPVPGDMEGFGISVIEASASGALVVASRLEGLVDAIKDGCNGVLVESKDASGWMRTIETLLANIDDRLERKARGKIFTLSNYSWGSIAQIYVSFLQKLVNRQK